METSGNSFTNLDVSFMTLQKRYRAYNSHTVNNIISDIWHIFHIWTIANICRHRQMSYTITFGNEDPLCARYDVHRLHAWRVSPLSPQTYSCVPGMTSVACMTCLSFVATDVYSCVPGMTSVACMTCVTFAATDVLLCAWYDVRSLYDVSHLCRHRRTPVCRVWRP